MDNFDRDLLSRFVQAAERIASALETANKPGMVAENPIDPNEKTVDGWARVKPEVPDADK